MTSQESVYKDDLSIYLQHLLSTVTPENSLDYFNDIINSIRTVCSNIREDEEDKKILWRNIAETIFEILGEND